MLLTPVLVVNLVPTSDNASTEDRRGYIRVEQTSVIYTPTNMVQINMHRDARVTSLACALKAAAAAATCA